MFQCVEMTEARSVWVDSPTPEFGMGFLQSTRVEIVLNPDGVSDWKEPGTAYMCTLMAGLWPDKDELALMVLGYSPGSEEALQFLRALVPDIPDLAIAGDAIDAAHKALLEGVKIMPVWDQAVTRMVFVTGAFTRGTAKDDSLNLQRTGAGGQQPGEMSFDHWHLMLDLALKKRGLFMVGEMCGQAMTNEILREKHSKGSTVEEIANAIQELTKRDNEVEPVDADADAGSG